MKSYFAKLLLVACLLLPLSAYAGELSFAELRRIADAGGSIGVNLDARKYSPNELMLIAQSLKHGAILTIKMKQQHLTANECVRIAHANPGRVRFVFD